MPMKTIGCLGLSEALEE
jgi:hypothetical protein